MDNQAQSGQGRSTSVPAVEVKSNCMIVNSRVWKGDNPNSPYSFYARWYVKNRNGQDVNSIRVALFTNQQNHPVANAQKDDLVRFDRGTLRFKTEKLPDNSGEKVVYAEVLVHEQLSVEKVEKQSTSQNQSNQQSQQQPQPAAAQPAGAQSGSENAGQKPIF